MTISNTPTTPLDIKPPWLNVARRLQSVARDNNQGFAIIAIRIIVNADGVPIGWASPTVTCIEPKRSNFDLDSFLGSFTDGKDG